MADSTVATANGGARIPRSTVRARKAGFARDVGSVAGRAIRSILRDAETLIFGIVVGTFFFVVNVGALQSFTESIIPGFDFKAFQLPMAILFSVTGQSRALMLVTDIQDGYFDRLRLTPVSRLALLLGLMVGDLALMIGLAIPVIVLGFLLGVSSSTGLLGILVFLLLSGVWGLAYAGFPYALALKTGNPAAVNLSFLIFFPAAFLTTAYLPREALTGWLATAADYNPVTYLLDGLRSLLMTGWDGAALGQAFLAVGLVGAVGMTLALKSLAGRVARG